MGARDETYGPLAVDDLVLDRYRVIEHVATGGHSEVFRGRDERLSRPVCIKVFSKFPDDPGVWRTAYEHFVQEAFALSRLSHPNTLRIYDFGHLSRGGDQRTLSEIGTPLQVSEFMNGGTLSQLVRDKGAQPVAETLRLATAMCEALDEAHEVGLVHRDIKPQNILFAAAGASRVAKLADFGIAKWLDDSTPPGSSEARISVDFSERAGDTQVVAGIKMAMYSPSWAAPEQLAGKVIGPPADIYSLAVVIVYMLTGKAIFAEEDVQRGYRKRRRISDVLRDSIGPLRLPSEAVQVLARALAFAPEERQRRATDLAHDLIQAFEPRTAELQRMTEGPYRDIARDQSAVPEAIGASPLSAEALVPQVASAATPRRMPVRAPSEDASELPPPPSTPAQVRIVAEPAAGRQPEPQPEPPSGDDPVVTSASPAARSTASNTTARHAAPRRIAPAQTPQRLGDRMVRFAATTDGTADIDAGEVRLRFTVMPEIDGRRPVHVKGLTCFVSRRGGRPTAAVLLEHDGDFDLVSPRSHINAGGRLSRGSPAAGHTVFQVGAETIALAVDDCVDPLLIDFGPGADCHIIYAARRAERPRPRPRRSDPP
jgi:serine/threonine protein kinase